jgi:long-chain acyl-CoA synthetase
MSAVVNVADLVRAAAQRDATHPALVDAADGRTLTWGELDSAVSAEAARLRADGAQPGDRIAVKLPTGLPFCVAVLGALRAGCAVVPIGPGVSRRELERVLADSGARTVIDSEDVPALDTSFTPGDAVRGGEDLAVLAYTSGTSGSPRGVMLSHRALLANTKQCSALRPSPVTAADRVLLALPLFHVYGLGPGLFQVCASGGTGVLLARFDAEAALDAIENHRVTTLVGVPPMYTVLLRQPAEVLRERLATVRVFTSGAAPLDFEVLRGMREITGLDVYEGYGLTETGPVLTTTLGTGRIKPGSVGQALPGVEVRLVDSDGEALPDGFEMGEDAESTGLVAARGANLLTGYWPDGSDGPDADGWFRTGDVGYFDSDGDLHLVDRAGDLIIVNGFNVYPHEVESVLAELSGVRESAAVGVPDENTGEAVKVVIIRADASDLSEETVLAHCAERLAKFKVPTRVEFVDALPHTATGKLARRKLRDA